MAMTAAVKDELSRVDVSRATSRRAEVATILRFAGALHLIGGHIVIEAELDTGSVARRLRKEIAEIFGHGSEVQIVAGGGLRKGSRYLVRVTKDGEGLARQAGLVDLRGRPVRGLPHHVVAGGIADAEAAWRGAFLAHGSLTEPGRACSLEITCPSTEAALALVGVGRRLGVPSKAREVRGSDRVVVRDGDAIGALLTRIGAHASVLAWEERRMRREVRATANRLANFDDANLRRSARAAVAAGARVERAMEILADEARCQDVTLEDVYEYEVGQYQDCRQPSLGQSEQDSNGTTNDGAKYRYEFGDEREDSEQDGVRTQTQYSHAYADDRPDNQAQRELSPNITANDVLYG